MSTSDHSRQLSCRVPDRHFQGNMPKWTDHPSTETCFLSYISFLKKETDINLTLKLVTSPSHGFPHLASGRSCTAPLQSTLPNPIPAEDICHFSRPAEIQLSWPLVQTPVTVRVSFLNEKSSFASSPLKNPSMTPQVSE